MTPKEVFELGVNRGYSIGKNSSEVEYNAFMDSVYAVEESDRDFSPFEFTAKALNDLQGELDNIYENNSFTEEQFLLKDWFLLEYVNKDVWEVFEEGITKGFEKAWNEK